MREFNHLQKTQMYSIPEQGSYKHTLAHLCRTSLRMESPRRYQVLQKVLYATLLVCRLFIVRGIPMNLHVTRGPINCPSSGKVTGSIRAAYCIGLG